MTRPIAVVVALIAMAGCEQPRRKRTDTDVGAMRCEPIHECGCWSGCALFQRLDYDDKTVHVWRRVDIKEWILFERRAPSAPRRSGEIQFCDTAVPPRCMPVLEERAPTPCEESCLPEDAPYHCERIRDDKCKQIDH